ncbi:arginine repressor [Bifidobacterium pullorum subsp. saeculare]|uniref:Arginine repressor n=1 Tax=Bifidobacterium pullorum subsp. saeculare TaxID=78257 RepID=A0A938WWY9_9BIFI|nr:arginine repressor [Bifidobacterium pullorum]MBM6699118.1 arginine repressor [Bifidobacterium pullorum subsp. saeculare]
MSDASMPLRRPATRAARLSAIEEALARHVVTSQSQLSDILAREGIEVTQATLSRDLDELDATKTRLKDGTIAYAVPGNATPLEQATAGIVAERTEQQMARVLGGLVVSVAAARNLVVVHTPSGAAQYVASVIDRQPIEGVLGTIAGDDTVMAVCADDATAEAWSHWLLGLVSAK